MLILERHLMPAGLPVFPRVRLAARHLVAAHGPGGGGFDAFALGGGTVALMAGHVLGHGPGAAAAMAELREVLRLALQRGAGLDEALGHAGDCAARAPDAEGGAAVCLGLLDPAAGSLHYASAGHPAPLVCAPGGPASALPQARGGPLGAGSSPPAIAHAVLAAGSVLLLCSGPGGAGRGAGGTPDPARLAAAVTPACAGEDLRGADAAERVCQAVAGRLAGRPGGDVTVLAGHLLSEPAPGLSMRLAGEPADLRRLRARLAEWLEELGVAPLDRVDTELAVYEATANAITHGRPGQGAATVTVEIGLDGTGAAMIEVADRGRWRVRSGDDQPGGRGLSVISKVTSQLSITPSPEGTTVVMRRTLSHPVTVNRVP